MEIKTVYFDIGGVIFKDGMKKFLRKVTESYPIPNAGDSLPIYTQLFHEGELARKLRDGGISMQTCFENANDFLIQNYNFYLFDSISEENLASLWFEQYEPISGIFELMAKLKKKNYTIGIISANFEERFEYLFNKYDLGNFVTNNQIFLSHRLGIDKRNLKFYSEIIKSNNITPSTSLYIDDGEDFVNSASKTGMIAFRYDSKLGEKLSDVFNQIPFLETL